MLATEAALRRIDGRLEEAAPHRRRRRGRVLRRITLPLAAPIILAAALVVFVLAVSEFGVPGLLRVRVYTTEVFTAFAALYDFSAALVLAVAAAGVLRVSPLRPPRRCWETVWCRRAGSPGAIRRSSTRWRRAGQLDRRVVFVTRGGLPIAVLAREALSVRSLRAPLAGSGEAIANSLILATLGATRRFGGRSVARICAGAGRGRVAHLADILFVVLFAVPSTIVGVGLIGLWNRPGALGAVYGTDAMFLLAYLARFVPVAALILAAASGTFRVA